MSKVTIETTTEWCPGCGNEVDIPADRPSACPKCGEELFPCSICSFEKGCDWTETVGCWRFPKKTAV